VTGETILFWIVGPLTVLGALGLVFSRKAVHGALSLAVTMIGLAVLYIAQEAPFLGVVQIVVYTGAIMMLFLFVIMLVGVDASDSRVETIKGQRGWAAVLILGMVLLLGAIVTRAVLPDPAGMAGATPDGNVYGIADQLFGRHVAVFEVVAALLITAAIGAMTLTHREEIFRKPTQRELAEKRFREGDPGEFAGLPVPGVYARHNAVDVPALLPDGTPAPSSVSRVLDARGSVRSVDEFAGDVVALSDNTEAAEGGSGEPDADRGSESGPGSVEGDAPTGGERE
jgi:NADH-quinone oxidoreductase subunit J